MARATVKRTVTKRTTRVKKSDIKSGTARCPVCGKFTKKK